MTNTSDTTQAELDEILNKGYRYEGHEFVIDTPYLKQAILDWHNKQIEVVLDRLVTPTIADVFPSKPYDGTNTYEDMLSVVAYYKGLIEAERKRLENE